MSSILLLVMMRNLGVPDAIKKRKKMKEKTVEGVRERKRE